MSEVIAALVAFSIVSNPTAAGYWWYHLERRPAPRQVLVAGALVIAICVISIMLAEPLLAALRISPGTWRIATGALVIVGILGLALRPRPFMPARLEGPQPDWLPAARLAVWVCSPGLLAVVISLTLDEGAGMALFSVLFGVGLLMQMLLRAPLVPRRIRLRAWRELSRVTALVGLIVAVQFILAGIYTA